AFRGIFTLARVRTVVLGLFCLIVYTFFTLAPEAATIAELPVFMGVSAISAYCITSRFITFHHIFLLPKVVKAVVNSSVNQAVSRSISSRAEV
ncbi:MAG: hypothetical protein OSJ72_21425, partial [Lachnospiraceae bacterium]|nr:hypothetical protein [Lachnospiraceae bacterium]